MSKDTAKSLLFQSTRPRGRTRRTTLKRHRADTCFNPRVLAGGRDVIEDKIVITGTVSIHASSREDATSDCSVYGQSVPCFNPRVLAGGRDMPF